MSCLGEWPFLEKFDGVIVSGLERLVKPDPRIYRVFCERYGLAPENLRLHRRQRAQYRGGAEVRHARHPLHVDPKMLRKELIALGLPLKAK